MSAKGVQGSGPVKSEVPTAKNGWRGRFFGRVPVLGALVAEANQRGYTFLIFFCYFLGGLGKVFVMTLLYDLPLPLFFFLGGGSPKKNTNDY